MIDNIEKYSVILMCGISGSGKTHFSKLLEDRGYKRLSLDEYIWNVYGQEFTSLPAEKKKEIFISAAKELDILLSDSLRKGERVVVDSTMCKKHKRRETADICRQFGAESLTVYLKTSLQVLKDRLARRKGAGPNDQIVSDEDLQSYYANFQAPTNPENFVVYDYETITSI